VCDAFAQELAISARIRRTKSACKHNSIRPTAKANPEELQALRRRFGIGEDEPVILSVGGYRKKSPQRSYRCLPRLCEDNAEMRCKLLIVGEGPERTRWKRKRDRRAKSQNYFRGTGEQCSAILCVANVFVLPSHSEGSPNVLLEAMAAEVPLVATAVAAFLKLLRTTKPDCWCPWQILHPWPQQ